jgi:DivIVA domain-containing protein
MRKKDAATDVGAEWSAGPASSGGWMTAGDVQEKEFHVTRVGAGYRMREVDEFLDQVTDTLSALIAENDRLRGAAGPERVASLPMTRPRAADPEDRGAVEAFLQREKGFLQDLGGLVQAHAEELRSMVRAVRRDAVPPAVGPVVPPADPVRVEAPSGTIEPPPEPEPETKQEPTDPPATSDRVDDRAAAMTIAPMPITQAEGDEPILLEEPEPARSRRSEEDEGNSLRELFWGEE